MSHFWRIIYTIIGQPAGLAPGTGLSITAGGSLLLLLLILLHTTLLLLLLLVLWTAGLLLLLLDGVVRLCDVGSGEAEGVVTESSACV